MSVFYDEAVDFLLISEIQNTQDVNLGNLGHAAKDTKTTVVKNEVRAKLHTSISRDKTINHDNISLDKAMESTSASTITLKQCVCSVENLLFCLWYGCNFLRYTMMLGGLNIWLYDITGGDMDESK